MITQDDLFQQQTVGYHAEVTIDFRDVQLTATTFTSLWIAEWAPLIVATARESIVTDRRPSKPGHPPHTKGKPNHNLRDAIKWFVDDSARQFGDISALLFDFPYAVVYVDQKMVGRIGEVMERGGYFRGRNYAARPFLQPALEKNFNPALHNLNQLDLFQTEVENAAEGAIESFFN